MILFCQGICNLRRYPLCTAASRNVTGEEADLLSDQIVIMYLGRLRAIGSPIGLKQAYGKGYKVDVILNDNYTGEDICQELSV